MEAFQNQELPMVAAWLQWTDVQHLCRPDLGFSPISRVRKTFNFFQDADFKKSFISNERSQAQLSTRNLESKNGPLLRLLGPIHFLGKKPPL